jgi:hypothetical protein
MRNRTRAAPVMGFPPSGQALVGDDFHNNGIALDGASDTERDAILGVNRE